MDEFKAFFTQNPGWVFYFTGLLLLQAGIMVEFLISRTKNNQIYNMKDSLTNMVMYSGYFIILLFWTPVVFSIYSFVQGLSFFDFGPYWLDPSSIHFWWQWAMLLILEDLCFYVFHISNHKIRFLWASHINHHSSQNYNLSVGFRQTWTPFFVGSLRSSYIREEVFLAISQSHPLR